MEEREIRSKGGTQRPSGDVERIERQAQDSGMDLFNADPSYGDLLARIQALEAAVFPKAVKAPKEAKPEPLMAAWTQWEDHRKGKGWTANARMLNMRKLRELAGEDGELAIKIVQQSIEFGWQGLFPLKTDAKPVPAPQPHKTVAQALAPTESRLDRHLGWLRQQFQLGQITQDEYTHQAREARERMG
jgi:hypothetical protein